MTDSDGGFFGEDVLDWSAVVREVGKPVYMSCPTDLSSRNKYYLQVSTNLQTYRWICMFAHVLM